MQMTYSEQEEKIIKEFRRMFHALREIHQISGGKLGLNEVAQLDDSLRRCCDAYILQVTKSKIPMVENV